MKPVIDPQSEERTLKDQQKVLGWLGVMVTPIILWPSIDAGHTGGVLAAVATLVCSIWLIRTSKNM